MSETDVLEEVLFTNRAFFAAQTLDTFAFGAYVVIAGMSLYLMHQQKISSVATRVTVAYTWSMLFITIAWYYCTTRVTEAQLIEDPMFLESPSAILSYCSGTNVAGEVLSTLQFLGSDALLFFRAFMLFEKRWAWMIVPGAIFLSYLGFGIATNLACLSPEFGGKLPLLPVEQLANIFYTLTASMTIILTSMICFKLLRHRRLMAHKSGAFRDHRSTYLSIVGILVESALPYATCCWIWVILSITNNPAVDWFDGVITAASFLAQSWIVLRIAMGHSYHSNQPSLPQSAQSWNMHTPSPGTPISASIMTEGRPMIARY